jgi:hypothetical protein
MLSFLPRWRTVAGVLAAAAMSLTFVVPVSAAATINRFTETTTSYNDFTDDCTGASGLLIEVAVVDGQSVATSTGFHFEGTVPLTAFVAFNNGTYASGAGKETSRSRPRRGSLSSRRCTWTAVPSIPLTETFCVRRRSVSSTTLR